MSPLSNLLEDFLILGRKSSRNRSLQVSPFPFLLQVLESRVDQSVEAVASLVK